MPLGMANDMVLSEAPTEKILHIAEINIKDDALYGRLSSLGLIGGADVKVLSRDKKGGTIILIKGTRLALDKDLSRAISVI